MKSKRSTGFTLIEVLIAVGLLGMLITSMFAIWTSILKATRAAQEATAAMQRGRIAIEAVEDALLSTQMYAANIRHYPFVVDHWNESSTLSLTCRLPDSFPGSGLFGGQVMRRVSFSVEPDVDGSRKLVMSQIPTLFITNDFIQPYSIDLAKNVQFFVLEFWDQRAGEWTEDLLTTNVIPRVVRVTLGLGTPGANGLPKEIVARTVAIPSIAVTRELQVPAGKR